MRAVSTKETADIHGVNHGDIRIRPPARPSRKQREVHEAMFEIQDHAPGAGLPQLRRVSIHPRPDEFTFTRAGGTWRRSSFTGMPHTVPSSKPSSRADHPLRSRCGTALVQHESSIPSRRQDADADPQARRGSVQGFHGPCDHDEVLFTRAADRWKREENCWYWEMYACPPSGVKEIDRDRESSSIGTTRRPRWNGCFRHALTARPSSRSPSGFAGSGTGGRRAIDSMADSRCAGGTQGMARARVMLESRADHAPIITKPGA